MLLIILVSLKLFTSWTLFISCQFLTKTKMLGNSRPISLTSVVGKQSKV